VLAAPKVLFWESAVVEWRAVLNDDTRRFFRRSPRANNIRAKRIDEIVSVLYDAQMSPNKIRTNIFLEKKQMDALRKMSVDTDTPIARLIRRGIDLVLKTHKSNRKATA
jgi:hypothetical protein